ncbi:hypothetical protein F511_21360 [Dorcoceras hygrometricum]|uniref:Uncharacterized protein n=1 Tax=Dorcoceras hygrometricum TaxID=472368 RepID=A0A2Z7BMG2_9LAMI|nr:hypothetical protein F511_21360 [Dorcoceras hygrometricum]
MGKAALLRYLQERFEEGASGATPEAQPAPTVKKRRAPTPPIPTIEERSDPMPVIVIPEVPSSKVGPTTEMGPGRALALNLFEDSLVVSPSGVVATRFLCNMVLDRDAARLRGAINSDVVGLLAAQFAAKFTVELELEDTKARAETEIGRLRSEAANTWDLVRDRLPKLVAQFRANGYSEEEHPTPFLSMTRALDELPIDDEEETDEGDEEEDDEGATPPSPPKQYKLLSIEKPELVVPHAKSSSLSKAVARGGALGNGALSRHVSQVGLPSEEVSIKIGLMCRADRAYALKWKSHLRSCQYGIGLRFRAGRAYLICSIRLCFVLF